MIRTLFALSLCLAAPAAAQDEMLYYSADGDIYVLALNENGAVLTSKYPKAWFTGQGADFDIDVRHSIFYFGKSCDAYHDVYGEGTWGWSNFVFGAHFENRYTLLFPRQELIQPEEWLMACMDF
jgi:hypothetical protein